MIILPSRANHHAMPTAVNAQNKGLATLLFCLILLTSATTLIFTMARTSLAEQRIMGNEYHAESLRQACAAGFDYGLAWLRQHPLEWQLNNSDQYTLTIPLAENQLNQDADIFIQLKIYTNDIGSPFFQLQAQANRNNTGICQMRQFVHYTTIDNTRHNTDIIARVITVPGTWNDYD